MNTSSTSLASSSPEPSRWPLFWRPMLEEGGIVIASPYRAKYHGGVSPRDALAMANVVALFSLWKNNRPVRAEIRASLTPEIEQENLILIGSGSVNLIVPEVLADLEKAGTPLSFSLGSGFWHDRARRHGAPTNLIPRYVAETLFGEAWDLGAQFCRQDFGLVARAPNPHKPGKFITFIAGIHGYGTLAASHVFCTETHQAEIERRLRSKPLEYGFDSEAIGRDAVVEVILRATVADNGHDRANSVRALTAIDIEFVRIGSRIDRQSPSDPPELWTHLLPEPRRAQHLHQLSLYCDNADKGSRAFVHLQGLQSRLQFCPITFNESDCRDYDTRIRNSIHGRDGWTDAVRRIGQDLEDKLRPLLLLAPQVSQHLLPHELVYSFAGPSHHLRIPFEVARIHGDQSYLSLVHPVIRSISGVLCTKDPLSAELTENLRLQGKRLRVLLIASNPLGDLASADEEVFQLEESLGKFSSLIEVTTFTGRYATSDAFGAALRSDYYHIVHYAGHSHWDRRDPRRSFLLLYDAQANKPEPVYLRQIENGLRSDSNLCFFYLSSCDGAGAGTGDLEMSYDFSGIADSLVRAGVPAVLGFREAVDDRGAKVIAQHFYQSLCTLRALSLPHALLLARRRIEEEILDSPLWLMPVLVMQK